MRCASSLPEAGGLDPADGCRRSRGPGGYGESSSEPLPGAPEAALPAQGPGTRGGNLDSSLDNTVISLSINTSQSKSAQIGRKYYTKPFDDLCKRFKNLDCFDDELNYLHDSSQLEEEDIVNVYGNDIIKNTAMHTETDVTLPSNLAANTVTGSDYNTSSDLGRKTRSRPETKALSGQSLIPSHIKQIYEELFVIHQKLQQENSAQQEYALQLQKREQFLAEREALLFRHEAALTKIRGVEEEVHAKFQMIKEQYETEVKQLSDALREKTKENKRLKSSFDTLKEMNDSLRKQLSDVSEQNKKLEVEARKVQARLENLQRKHEFLIIQKSKDVSQAMQQSKPVKQEKMVSTSKIAKVPLNLHVYDLLTVLMDWISDQYLSKMKAEEEREDSHKVMCTSQKNYTQEKCAKLLPMVAEQLQWMPFVNPQLHRPVIKFIYWALRHLDSGTQHATMTSTMRRLGEDVFRGIISKGNQHSSSEQPTDNKPKSAAFFKSSILPLRFVSTLIVLKTVTQADYLAQAFDSLCMDLKTDEGKTIFLEYQSVPVILSHLKISSRGLLSNALDALLQMTVESGFLQPFLEACSNESFFRTCSVLLRNPKLDLQILEKLSILLQKLSRIKSNKKMFELFTLHLMIQELQRTTHPDHAFLSINLNSILFNLGLTKSNSLVSNLNTSH
ncbi:coiled-coil domain-containing protein 138 isoform X1 [Alligator sinensis]|uniref:Coiled-coil domain-containing protein 138 isoform X1 n=1 Tax=Alligator sinensis TaxID=38654 RepID=A0A3Q0HBC7_ALLSI|nr:coiled-coil domain-containing protein 138 isoform X1 [Alligator sinensis]